MGPWSPGVLICNKVHEFYFFSRFRIFMKSAVSCAGPTLWRSSRVRCFDEIIRLPDASWPNILRFADRINIMT
jgi:hypothetical protein